MENIKKSKRIYYLDLVRGLAVFFMVMQHTMLVNDFSGGEEGIISGIFVLLGTAPAAPVFMFIMGIFIMKSKLDDKSLFIRGIKLLITGYVLNLLRFTLPMFIAGEGKMGLTMFWGVDILQLAGLSFILAIGVRKIANNKYVVPVLSGVILLVSPFLWGITSNPITDLLWGTNGEVAFPFFPWCIYPMLGMYFSQFLAKPEIDKAVKKRILIGASITTALGLATVLFFPHTDYSRYGFGASLLIIAFVLFYLLLSETIVNKYKKFSESKVAKTIYYWSKEVTNIYIVQWVIFGWGMLFLGANEFGEIASMLIGFAVMLITHIVVRYTKVNRLIPKV